MIFAPLDILTLYLIYIVLVLLCVYLSLYLVYVLVRYKYDTDYKIKVKAYKKRYISLFIFIVLLDVLVGFFSLKLYHSEQESKALLQEELLKRNPTIEKEMIFEYITLPKGTQLYNYNKQRHDFTSAHFKKPFLYHDIWINAIENPNFDSAKITLSYDTQIGELFCAKKKSFYYYFKVNNMVSKCELVKDFTLDSIKWDEGSIASNNGKSYLGKHRFIHITGKAKFSIKDKNYHEVLEYIKYIDFNQRLYINEQKEILYQDVNFLHPNVIARGKSVLNEVGKYSITFDLGIKNIHYKVRSLDTGKIYRGTSNHEGESASIETETQEAFELYLEWNSIQ